MKVSIAGFHSRPVLVLLAVPGKGWGSRERRHNSSTFLILVTESKLLGWVSFGTTAINSQLLLILQDLRTRLTTSKLA